MAEQNTQNTPTIQISRNLFGKDYDITDLTTGKVYTTDFGGYRCGDMSISKDSKTLMVDAWVHDADTNYHFFDLSDPSKGIPELSVETLDDCDLCSMHGFSAKDEICWVTDGDNQRAIIKHYIDFYPEKNMTYSELSDDLMKKYESYKEWKQEINKFKRIDLLECIVTFERRGNKMFPVGRSVSDRLRKHEARYEVADEASLKELQSWKDSNKLWKPLVEKLSTDYELTAFRKWTSDNYDDCVIALYATHKVTYNKLPAMIFSWTQPGKVSLYSPMADEFLLAELQISELTTDQLIEKLLNPPTEVLATTPNKYTDSSVITV